MNKLLEDFYNTAKSGDAFSLFGTGKTQECIDEMTRMSDMAKDVITKKMSERDIVKTMLIVQKFVAAIGAANGQTGILMAEMDGSLQGYTHTVVLTTIGLLMDEEVL